MGICVSRLYFEKGLPTVAQIQEQFEKQTGLAISLRADINLLELPLNDRVVIEKLTQDLHQYEQLINGKFDGDFKSVREEIQKINHLGWVGFNFII